MDRFDAMNAFARVAETGSFTRAAQTLRMSRPTITQLVQQLEARLGVRLLHRTTRAVKLTAEGAAYHARVVRLLAELEDVEATARGASAAPRGRLRVDAPAPFARRIMIPALPAFQAQYPEIEIILGVSDREVDIVADGVDCVIRGGEPPASALKVRRLGDLPFGIHASPDYVKRRGRPQHPRELEGPQHSLVGFLRQRTGNPRPLELRRGNEIVVVEGRHGVSVDDGDAYVAAGLAGLGIIAAPDYMTSSHVARGELTPLLEGWQVAPMPLVVLSPASRQTNGRLRVFIDWVLSLMAATRRPAARGAKHRAVLSEGRPRR